MNVKQAAEQLGVTPRTVLRMIDRGEIRAEKNGEGQTSSYVIDPAEITAHQAQSA